MAATEIEIVETNGTGATDTVVSRVDLGWSDAAELSTGYVAPNTASYEKWLRFRVTVIADGISQLDNFKLWVSPAISHARVMASVRTSQYVALEYPAEGPAQSTSVANRPLPTFEPINANIGIGGSLTGRITAADELTDYVVLTLFVENEAPQGVLDEQTIILQWDEQ